MKIGPFNITIFSSKFVFILFVIIYFSGEEAHIVVHNLSPMESYENYLWTDNNLALLRVFTCLCVYILSLYV